MPVPVVRSLARHAWTAPTSVICAHRDQDAVRPLHTALDSGAHAIEVDVYLARGRLLVGHDEAELVEHRTLGGLYLDPLLTRHALGRLPPLTLLVDVKSEAEATYLALDEQLRRYDALTTRFGPAGVRRGPVHVLVTGNIDLPLMAGQPVRRAAADARLADLAHAWPRHLVPLVSENWTRLFRWDGDGEMSIAEQRRLSALAGRVHASGRRLRFWATPDRPSVWDQLRRAGVDVINTDAVPDLFGFLAGREAAAFPPASRRRHARWRGSLAEPAAGVRSALSA